jgi:sugar phosphate isomerase/epimerase
MNLKKIRNKKMRLRTKTGWIVLLLVCCFFASLCAGAVKEGLINEFFAMDTGTIDENHTSAKAQVEMLNELGYAGIAYWEGNPKRENYGLPEMLRELDRHGLKMFPLYFGINLDPDKLKYDPSLKEAMKLLKGRDATIWLHIMSEKYKKSSPEGDERAVEIVREIADMAHEKGLRVALYPHFNDWMERVGDAVRVTEKVNRRNVGITFNLCHWLKVDNEENMEDVLKLAMPYLFMVTINGADSNGKSWNELIQPLGQGSFDIYKFLKTLKEMGYTGPIGLQGYGIGGDVHENLKRSMNAWRRLSARMRAEEK